MSTLEPRKSGPATGNGPKSEELVGPQVVAIEDGLEPVRFDDSPEAVLLERRNTSTGKHLLFDGQGK